MDCRALKTRHVQFSNVRFACSWNSPQEYMSECDYGFVDWSIVAVEKTNSLIGCCIQLPITRL